ncbi:uncharacterized protein FFB14_10465 [Fusarium fujikuroi]|nr:uncharacterized protein FFB14_10465 [Fusarium fujikuroi]
MFTIVDIAAPSGIAASLIVAQS